MINLIKLSDCPLTPWKNGKGLTRQIDIYPPGATVAGNDFLWRLSSATVSEKDFFSSYPGCDRLLVVWQGDGLLLNEKTLLPNSPLLFPGEKNILCDLINKSVIDLGLIFKRDKVKARMDVLTFKTTETLKIDSPIEFYFLADGESCSINQVEMKCGDVLKVENAQELILSAKSEVLFYRISIWEIN